MIVLAIAKLGLALLLAQGFVWAQIQTPQMLRQTPRQTPWYQAPPRSVTPSVTRSLPAVDAMRGSMSLPSAPSTFQPRPTNLSIENLRRAVARDPNNPQVWITLGQAFLNAERYEDARSSFLEAVALEYRNADAHFGLGLSEYARGDFQGALFSFNEMTRLFPERFDGHFNKGVTFTRLRNYEEGEAAFAEAIAQAAPEASPQDIIAAHLGRASLLKELDQFEPAATEYQAAIDVVNNLGGDDTELTFLYGDAMFRAGLGLDVLADLVDIEANTDDYRVSLLIADIYTAEQRIDYAQRFLDRARLRAIESGDAQAQANVLVKLGLLRRDLGRGALAIQAFAEAFRNNPRSWQAAYNLGLAYLENGQTQDGLAALEQALAINPESPEIYLALASSYDRLNRPDDARVAAEAALTRLQDPLLRSEAQFILGRSLYRLGDNAGAISVLEQVVAEQPDNASAQLWAGLAEYALGNFLEAAQYYERAVQLNPNSIEARINLGAAYLAAENYADAELVYQLIIQDNPQDAEAYFNLGWALLSQSRLQEAREAWEISQDLGYAPAQAALSEYFN
jgi:tetratricopeptide (TPR) repeat protein